MLSLEQMQEAAKRIEADGDEAYYTVVSRFGPEIAQLLLVAHLRRAFGAMKSFPADPKINARVEEALRKKGILDQFASGKGGLRVLSEAETEHMKKVTGRPDWGCGD